MVLYRRYIDDVFCLFKDKAQSEKFLDYINTCHERINFTIEHEENSSLPFLDCKVQREDNEFSTSVFRKKSFSGVYTHFDSFLPFIYKENLLLALIHRCFELCSSFSHFHLDIVKLKEIIKKNGYPTRLFDTCVKKYLNKIFSGKRLMSNAAGPTKQTLTLVLPFLGSTSLRLRNKLRSAFKESSKVFNIRILFRTSCRVKYFLRFKDQLSESMRSHFVYEFKCSSCNATYYGQTTRHYMTRKAEHFRKSEFTGKHKESLPKTSVYKHMESQRHYDNPDDSFSIIASNPWVNEFVLQVQETILIFRDKPSINGNQGSVPLFLFA